MIRYTTPSQEFVFYEDPDLNFSRIVVSYSQRGKILIEKEKSDMTFSSSSEYGKQIYVASFRLTQEESSLLTAGVPLFVQVRALAHDGSAYASDMFELSVNDVLKKEVIYED